jgi:cation transport protein ChaC
MSNDADSVANEEPLWIFGYGSLVWRPDFPFLDRHSGFIEGWCRRFWQGSTDHRGWPHAPGRVATLVREAGARCWGSAYRVAAKDRRAVLAGLDHRERGGFERDEVIVHVRAGDSARLRALMYVATAENPNYLGPASIEAIAEQVQRCTGPSGSNREYVLRLAESLRDMGARDDHVFAIAERLGDEG